MPFIKLVFFLVNSLGVFGQFSDNLKIHRKSWENGSGLINKKQFLENYQQILCKC